jgi:hypothetical protein
VFNRIVLSRGWEQWEATFTGPHAAVIQEIFGFARIRTPYRIAVAASHVEKMLRIRYPNVAIDFADNN